MDLLARQLLYSRPAGTAAVPSNAKLRIWGWLTSLELSLLIAVEKRVASSGGKEVAKP